MNYYLICGLIYSDILLATMWIYLYVIYIRERHNLMEKIKQDGVRQKGRGTKILSGSGAVISWTKLYLTKVMSKLGNKLKPKNEGELSSAQTKLLRAGYRNRNAAIIFFGVKGFFVILFPSILLLRFFVFRPSSVSRFTFLLLLSTVISLYLPQLWLYVRISRRKERITEGFPDTLDLLVVCVEAGMGLDAAINRVADEMKLVNNVISEELQMLNLELRAGKPRLDALRSLAFRTDLDDVKSLVTLLIQADRFGTSVAQALRIQSDSMRTKRYQKAEEKAAQLSVKLLFPLIFCIFPSLFIIILGPAVIRLLEIYHR
ncbi:MAG: type II secretion system F family protein [bacterium]